MILGYPKGLHLVIFLNHNSRFDYRLAVLDDSPIKKLSDFKGADIGEITHGGTGEIPADVTLSAAGLKPGDYTYSPIGLGPQALAAITSKKVDAVIFPLQEIEQMEAVGHVKFRTFEDPRFADVPSEGFTTTPETLAAKSDLLKRFSRAMVKAFVFMRVNPRAAARMYLEGTNQKVTPELLDSLTSVVTAMEPEFPAYDLSASASAICRPKASRPTARCFTMPAGRRCWCRAPTSSPISSSTSRTTSIARRSSARRRRRRSVHFGAHAAGGAPEKSGVHADADERVAEARCFVGRLG